MAPDVDHLEVLLEVAVAARNNRLGTLRNGSAFSKTITHDTPSQKVPGERNKHTTISTTATDSAAQ